MSDRTPQEAEAIERGAEAFFEKDMSEVSWDEADDGMRHWYRNAAATILAALTLPSSQPCPTCGGTSEVIVPDPTYRTQERPCPDCTDGTVPPLLMWRDGLEEAVGLLQEVTDELAQWGWGDIHYGDQPQEQRVLEQVIRARAYLSTVPPLLRWNEEA